MKRMESQLAVSLLMKPSKIELSVWKGSAEKMSGIHVESVLKLLEFQTLPMKLRHLN